jgi:putative ABC transport system permease protein
MEQAILTLDRNLVPQFSGTVDGWIDFQSFSKPRFSMMILVVFAAIGLILASIGVYGVVASTLAQKTREVAIRLALGAPPGRLWVFAVSLGLRMVMGGLVLGLAASWFLAQLIQRLLWRVSPQDPGTLAIVSVVLLAVGLAACHIASRPAMGASPSAVLRLE